MRVFNNKKRIKVDDRSERLTSSRRRLVDGSVVHDEGAASVEEAKL